MGMRYANKEFKEFFANGDPFEILEAIQGEVFRVVDGRKTFRFDLNGSRYFAKLHRGVGWREIAKNLFHFRWPIVDAENEWRAVQRLKSLGVSTLEPVAYGVIGLNPATRRSYLVTQDLTDTISLEDLGKQWLTQPPSPAVKRALIKRVATIAQTLHSHGMCHRDLYLCHFLLHQNEPELRVSLIDLHRAFSSPRLRRRWLIKDIGSLYYSCLHLNLSQRDLLRFIRYYDPRGLRYAIGRNADFWQAVSTKASSLYRRHGDAA
jgi:heptose I phosphotransferase